jgi:hypothetical protein
MHFTPCVVILVIKSAVLLSVQSWDDRHFLILVCFHFLVKRICLVTSPFRMCWSLPPSPLPPKINFEYYAFGGPPPNPHFIMLFKSYHQYLKAWLMQKLMKWEWPQCHIMKGYESMFFNRSLGMWSSHYLLAGCNTTKWKKYWLLVNRYKNCDGISVK